MRPKKKGKGLHHAGPYGLLARASCPDTLSEMGAIIGFEQRGGRILSHISKGFSGRFVKGQHPLSR